MIFPLHPEPNWIIFPRVSYKHAHAKETITKRDLRFGSSERKLNVAELPASDTHMTVITPKLLEKAWKKETGEDPSKSMKFTLKGVGNPFVPW